MVGVRAVLVGVTSLISGASRGVAAAPVQATPTPTDEVSFEREWVVQATPFYRVTVRGDGTGTVTTSKVTAVEDTGVVPIRVTPATVLKLFGVEPVLAGSKGCEAGGKNTAQTGKKTLTLRRGSNVLRCSFNYADQRVVQEAINAFSGIEATVEEGPKLVRLRRFDRLGLDAEIATFTQMVKNGNAIELGNLGPVLETLAGDGQLMDRVRERASDLLAMAQAGK